MDRGRETRVEPRVAPFRWYVRQKVFILNKADRWGVTGWPDAVPWLNELKKHKTIVTLSNGNMRLLIDMVSSTDGCLECGMGSLLCRGIHKAKHANLPWDTIFSTELFDTFKPCVDHLYSPAHHHLHTLLSPQINVFVSAFTFLDLILTIQTLFPQKSQSLSRNNPSSRPTTREMCHGSSTHL